MSAAPSPMGSPSPQRVLLAGLLAALLGCATILAVHRASPRTLVSSHGLLHAAVAQRFGAAEASGLPPENPFFAGEALPYYWTFQWSGARLGALLGLDPLRGLEAVVLLAMATLCVAGVWLGARLHKSVAAGLALPFLALAGALPQGPLVLLARTLRGGFPSDDGSYLWGVVHPMTGAMRVFDTWSMAGPMVNFFFNLTARPLGLATLTLWLAAWVSATTRGGAARFLFLGASVLLCSAFSSVVGFAVGGSLGAGALLFAFLEREPAERSQALRRASAAALAMGVGLALAFPTYRHLFGRAELDFHPLAALPGRLGYALESAWLLVLLALLGARRSQGEERRVLRPLFLSIGALWTAFLLVALPTGKEDTFFHASLVLLALPASGALIGASGRFEARRLFLLALFLPTLGVVLTAYSNRPPIPIASEGARLVRTPASSAEAGLYRWIDAHTAPDAVFVVRPRRQPRAPGGNTAELPALSERFLFTERGSHYLVRYEPQAEARVRIATELMDGRALCPEDAALVAALGREVYLLADDAADGAALAARWGEPLWSEGDWSLFRWERRP